MTAQQKREKRRERRDLIQFYKFDKNKDSINWLKPKTKTAATKTTGPASDLREPSLRYCPGRK